jgi:hypothetical protein
MKSNPTAQTVIYLLTLIIFAISIYFISARNSNILEQIRDEFKNQKQFTDSLMQSKEVNIEKELLSQLISEVKYYNEILNREQNDTLSYIVYIIAFFSIVAGFFGYRTIRDIRESVKEESNKITDFYEKTFSLLNDQAKISKDFYDIQYKNLNKKTEEVEDKIRDAKIEINRMVGQLNDIEAKVSVQIDEKQEERDNMKKETSNKITKDTFKGE